LAVGCFALPLHTLSHRSLRKTVISFAVLIFFAGMTDSGRAATIIVPAGGDLQGAINAAQAGDTIILQAGAAYVGPFILPLKSGTAYVAIQSSGLLGLADGTRVSPAQAASFAKLLSGTVGEPIVKTVAGAHHYKFIGIEFSTTNASVLVYDLVRFGDTETAQDTVGEVPHDLALDRCYIHGFATQNVRRGVMLNSAETTISNSYISDIHEIEADTQAICGWNGPGPFHIINNYLEAAGENILFGGADPSIPNLVPSNIEIRRNYLFKPLSWKVGDPSYAGNHWIVKNLLELKNAQNVVIDGNVLENCWVDGQPGIGVLFTVRNQSGTAPWSIVQNVTFSNNTVKKVVGALNFLGSDNEQPSQRGNQVTISNNLFDGTSGLFMQLNGFYGVTLNHNTHFQGANTYMLYGEQSTGFVATNNLTIEQPYGIFGDGGGTGTNGLNQFCPSWTFSKNVMVGASASFDPPGNFYPAQVADVGFTNYGSEDYSLLASSAYHNAGTDGKDIGADFIALAAAQSGISPGPSPTSTPTQITVRFSSANYTVSETAESKDVTVDRIGNSSSIVAVDYATSDGTAQQRKDYTLVAGKLTFGPGETSKTFTLLITDNVYLDGARTINLALTNPVGATLGSPDTAILTIADDDTSPANANPIDEAQFFIRQHYHDFLNRVPDSGGLAYWTGQVTQCGTDATCINSRRIGASGAFFVASEFQQSGYFVYRLYQASFGTKPTYASFNSDRSRLVGDEPLQTSTLDLVNRFVLRPAFLQMYPSSQTPAEFVNQLFDIAGLTPFNAERQQEVEALTTNGKTRAQVLLDVIDVQEFKDREYDPAFTLMQYFGYLRRDPDPAGYDFWLNVLNNRDPDNYRGMICAFITSIEYQERVSPVHTRTSADCQ
jgi:hypothetical protein